MMLRVLFILFLLCTPLRAGQVIVIPEGVTISPAIAMNALHRISEIVFERTNNTFTLLTVAFEYSPDKQANWIWYGSSIYPGGGATTAVLGSVKELPKGVTATHIRVVTTAVGGTITLKQVATVTTKPGKGKQ
jgi:hypothetical protein